ncbi:MAG: PilZ domain-containing protein [Nitrospirae bacterium]|nr:PilZ domain-containing protein [Nitrospirota bacterium]
MTYTHVASERKLQSLGETVNRRERSRAPLECSLMYSAQHRSGEILMGNGIVTDLSHLGLGIRGNTVVMPGIELALFLYLPDGKDPLFVMETKVAWTSGRQFGVEIIGMGLREGNRLRHFLCSTLKHSE